ncbi:MAG: prepilin-type N-terminal cleavage/methylation domain-containing protein [Phycisphaerae bacterium]|jgi:type II secretion system protein G|nr:prepilin-type N-terminal cleavage/methylation domain-containing protein [Phycisphaerae bacterium]
MIKPSQKRACRGFTLVEILIVVIILGILAAIVIPQISGFTTTSREAALKQNLKTIRSQLGVYYHEHTSGYPDEFVAQMTRWTDPAGNVSNSPSAVYYRGPYLEQMPANPYTNSSSVTVIDDASVLFTPPETSGGWWFNRATGEFRANLSSDVTSEGGEEIWRW